MSERQDDTSEETNALPVADDKESSGSYYYDDATNYEIYDPADDDEDEAQKSGNSAQKSE